MHAGLQDPIQPDDLLLVLALVRGGSLAAAAERRGVDPSTVFRGLQRLERALGEPLFERRRSGLVPGERAQALAAHGERLESLLEAAGGALARGAEPLTGTVRLSTTDAVLHGLVAPALPALARAHPLLQLELHAGNELASLTRRDADLALRATREPPPHLVGRRIGTIRVAPYAARAGGPRSFEAALAAGTPWVAPDDGLPDHPTVRWRRRHHPKLLPQCRTGSLLAVAELVAQGLGVGLLPMFLAEPRRELRRLGEPIADCASELWLLAHPESRHLRRVAAVAAHLVAQLRLD